MTIATQNKSEINKMMPDNVPLGNAPHETEVIAARLPVQLSKEPLLSSLRQSPRPGNNVPLALEKIERSRWYLYRYPRISGALLSNAFSYILRRAAIIPSMLFRQMDLPLFRRRRKPGRGLGKSANTVSNGPQATEILQMDETFLNMPLCTSGDRGEEERLSHVSDGPPGVILKPFPLPPPFNQDTDSSQVLYSLENANISPSVILRSSNIDQTEAEVYTPIAHDDQQELNARNTHFTNSEQHILPPEKKAGLSQQLIISRQRPQNVYRDRTLSRLLNPFKPGLFRHQEIAERNLPADSVSESPESPARDKSTVYPTNIHKKPIVMTLARKIKSVPIKLPLLKQFELSDGISPRYKDVSERSIDMEQAGSTKPDTEPIFSSKKNNMNMLDPVSRRIPPSVPPSRDTSEEPPSRSRSSQKVELSEEVVDDHEQNTRVVINKEQTIFSEPETKSGTVIKRHPSTLFKTVSRKTIPSLKPSTPKNDVSYREMFTAAPAEQYNPGNDKENAGKSWRSPMPAKTNNITIKSLNITQLEKTLISGETPAGIEVIPRPLADGEQSSPTLPVAEPAVIQKQLLPAIEKTISGKATQPAIPLSQDIIAGQPPKFRSFKGTELIAETAEDTHQDRLPVINADMSVSPGPEAAASIVFNQNNTNEVQTITRKTGEPPTTLSQKILNRRLSKSLTSQQGIRLSIRHIGFEQKNVRHQELIGKPAGNQTRYNPGTMYAGKEINKNVSESDAPNLVLYDSAAADKVFLRSNKSESLLNRKTGALNNAFTGRYPVIGNIFRSLKNSPPAITVEDSVMPTGAENTVSLWHHHKYINQPSLDLPVVSALQPQKDTQFVHSGKLSRSLSGTRPELLMSSPSYHTPDLPAMPVRRIVEPRLQCQTIVNQPQSEKRSNKEAAQDIRIIAEKVYAILKHELKIERARERHHLLR